MGVDRSTANRLKNVETAKNFRFKRQCRICVTVRSATSEKSLIKSRQETPLNRHHRCPRRANCNPSLHLTRHLVTLSPYTWLKMPASMCRCCRCNLFSIISVCRVVRYWAHIFLSARHPRYTVTHTRARQMLEGNKSARWKPITWQRTQIRWQKSDVERLKTNHSRQINLHWLPASIMLAKLLYKVRGWPNLFLISSKIQTSKWYISQKCLRHRW